MLRPQSMEIGDACTVLFVGAEPPVPGPNRQCASAETTTQLLDQRLVVIVELAASCRARDTLKATDQLKWIGSCPIQTLQLHWEVPGVHRSEVDVVRLDTAVAVNLLQSGPCEPLVGPVCPTPLFRKQIDKSSQNVLLDESAE